MLTANLRFVKLTILMSAMSIFSCSSLQTNSAGLTIAYSVNLPPILNETSGLVCDESGIYTINDSGNAPVIYQLDQQGNIQHQITLSSSNTDWEALTKDEDGFYIGEFGNNAGKRTKLSVIKVASTAISTPALPPTTKQITFNYRNYQTKQNIYQQHDYDAEALVNKGEKLVMFSKSWKSKNTHVYQLDKNQQNQLLEPIVSIQGLPGLVTGADWDELHQRYVLVGYQVMAWRVSPFIATLDETFTVTHIERLLGLGQVEGVCAYQGDVWITQEKLGFSRAKLVKTSL